MNWIRLEFAATECNGWPKIKLLIDDDLYEDYHFVGDTGTVKLPVDLMDGEHVLDIELYGKDYSNTLVDQNNNIVKDQLVELIDIYIDDVKLPYFLKLESIYKFNNKECPQSLAWGCNGTWSWPFSTPIVPWVLDKKQQHQWEQLGSDELIIETSTPEKLRRTLEMISAIEKEINMLDDKI